MTKQLLDWEPKATARPKQEIKILALISYIDSIYQQYQIDNEQYQTIVKLLNGIKNEEN